MALPHALAEERDNVASTCTRLDPAEIEACVGAILTARKVWLVGHCISQSFATYPAWQLVKLAPDVAVGSRGSASLGQHIAGMGGGDVVWCSLLVDGAWAGGRPRLTRSPRTAPRWR